MNSLTKYQATASGPVMSSLMIAEITGKLHENVLKDIRRTLEEAEIDPVRFNGVYKGGNGQDRPCYRLPRRECDLVISGYSVKYRLAIIDRWQELEAKQAFQIPQTLPEALRLAAELADTVAAQNEQLALAAPKVAFHDAVTASDTVCQMAVAAQVAGLPFGRNILFQRLREMGAFISGGERHNLPKQQYVNSGHFTVKEAKFENTRTGEPIVSFTTYATQRGIDWLVRTFKPSKS